MCLLSRYLSKKIINLDHEGTLEELLSSRVPQNQPSRVHLGVNEGPGGFPCLNLERAMRSNYSGPEKSRRGPIKGIP